jgi:hypothetical protein
MPMGLRGATVADSLGAARPRPKTRVVETLAVAVLRRLLPDEP